MCPRGIVVWEENMNVVAFEVGMTGQLGGRRACQVDKHHKLRHRGMGF